MKKKVVLDHANITTLMLMCCKQYYSSSIAILVVILIFSDLIVISVNGPVGQTLF